MSLRPRPAARLWLRLELPAVAASARVVRSTIGTIAPAAGVEPDLTADICTAVSEACNNAVLHAYPAAATPGALVVTLSIEGDSVDAVVRDHGCGIRAGPSPRGGLGMGLALIQSLTEQADCASSELGTAVHMQFRATRASEPLAGSVRRSGR